MIWELFARKSADCLNLRNSFITISSPECKYWPPDFATHYFTNSRTNREAAKRQDSFHYEGKRPRGNTAGKGQKWSKVTFSKNKGKIDQSWQDSFSYMGKRTGYDNGKGDLQGISWQSEQSNLAMCWGYRFWFLLIFWDLCEIGPFMPSLSFFFHLMFQSIYDPICKHLLFLSEFWIILNFRCRFNQ